MRAIPLTVAAGVNVTVSVLDAATGRVLHKQRLHNLVTLAGRNQIRDAINGLAIAAPSRIALGTSNTPVAANQTALSAEVWRDVFTSKTASSASLEIKYFLTSTTANGNTLREAGLLNAPSGGDLYARVVLTEDIIKNSSVAVLFVWTLTWSSA